MVVIRKAYEDTFVYGTTVIKEKSIVEPGQCLPMNKLIKGVINGSIVINPRFMEYDFDESLSDEFDAHGSPSEIAKQQNDAFISGLDKQSDVPSDPTSSPSFDAVDAENLAFNLASQGTLEGVSAVVDDAGAPSKKAGDGKSEEQPNGSLASDGDAN